MAEQRRPGSDEDTLENTLPRSNEDLEEEQNRVRSSNDRDQELERKGIKSRHNRGYDEALRGEDLGDIDERDVDPDSASSDVNRDDD